MTWDSTTIPKSVEQVLRELDEGTPGIMAGVPPRGITLAPNTMLPGDERLVAERVAQVLGERV